MARHVYRWDLDKTYIKTDFDSPVALLRTALQRPEEKENVPGTAALMRALKRGPDGTENKVFIISGSPREMRRVLSEKLRLDGVTIDGLELKPNLQNLLRLRFRAMRDQLGYKLPVLLESRAQLEPGMLETCFGDDAELDGLIYRLYADICEGQVDSAGLGRLLQAANLYPDQVHRILAATGRLPVGRVVERVCINLETGSPTGRFDALGALVKPTFNAFQTSLVLYCDGRLAEAGVFAVTDEMRERYGYTADRLSSSLQDALRRALVPRDAVAALVERLGLRLGPELPVRVLEDRPVDYVALLADADAWHKERKAGRSPTGLGRLFGGD